MNHNIHIYTYTSQNGFSMKNRCEAIFCNADRVSNPASVTPLAFVQKNIPFLLSFIILLLATPAQAQYGLHLQFLPHQASAQYIQPAYIANQQFKYAQISAEGIGWLANNQITLDALLKGGNNISEATKDQMLSQIGGDQLRVQAGYGWGVHANVKALKLNWQLSFRQNNGIYAGVNDSSSLGLLLRGNAPYAGQRLNDEDIFANTMKYNEFAIATAFTFQKLHLGVRAKYLHGLGAHFINDVSYSLLTADDGANIALQSQYDIHEARTSDPGSWGLGLDLGITYDLNEKLKLQASLLNLGFMKWDTRQLNAQIDIVYEGKEVGGINGGFSDGELFSADTLQQLIFPDTLAGTFNSPLGTSLQFGMSYNLSEKGSLHASIHQSFNRQYPATQIPILNMAYHYALNPQILVGANAFAGGLDRYGVGFVAATDFTIGEQLNLSLYGAADNILGGLISSVGRGVNVNVGVSVGF